MATAFANEGTHIEGEGAPQDDGAGGGAIDYEARAKALGWVPPEEFKGDPSRHVDAETFVKRGEEIMPILKAQNKRLERELADLRKTVAKASDYFSRAEQRGYEKAMADIQARQEAAVETGDVAAHRAAAKDAEVLRKEMEGAKSAASGDDEISPEQRAEEFADWGKVNKWYATNSVMAAYADSQAGLMAKAKGGFLGREDLDAVAEKVREKFEDDFPDAFGKAAAPRQKTPHVDAGGSRQPIRGGKTFNDLPNEAKQACDKWVKQGLIKSREDYVKSYQW